MDGLRSPSRLRKDFELADKIRDKLAEEYAVCIYEESKEWSVIAPRPSHSNDYNDLGMEPAENDVNKASEGASPSIGNYERYINGSDVAIAQDGPKEVESDDKQMGETASLENLTVVQLKEKLRAKGLPVSGRKAELIERLISG